MRKGIDPRYRRGTSLLAMAMLGSLVFAVEPAMAQKKPNVVMLMTDDTGWNDFGAYSGGGAALGHPTPNIDRIKDTWLGSEQNLGAIGAAYNLTMDPFEKYDMVFNGAVAARLAQSSPGKYAGQDNGWVLALIFPVVMEFNKSIADYPSIRRSPGGASNDWRPKLQDPNNPVPLLDMKNPPQIKGGGG